MVERASQEALFRSVDPAGKTVVLLVNCRGWAITCDGKTVADGTGEDLQIKEAVKRFRAMIHPRVKRSAART